MKKINLLILPMMLALVACGGGNSSSAKPSSVTPAASSVVPSSTAPSSVAPSSKAPSSVAPSSETPSSVAPSSEPESSVAPSSETPSSVAPSSDPVSSVTPSSETPSSVAPSSEEVDDTFIVEAEFSPDIEYLYDCNGFSGTASQKNIILEDTQGYGASNGYFVSYLYNYGTSLSYTIKSDKAVSNVTLKWRISGEFFNNQTYTCTDNTVTVNNKLVTYSSITLDNIPSQTSGQILALADYTLSTTISLKQGDNTLVYTTSNNTALGGTMYASAPLLDCFKFSNLSGATLDFTDAVDYYAD